jgi:hypothetical protein
LSCGATSGSQWLHELKHDGFRIRVTWTSCERLPARFPDPHARNVGLSTDPQARRLVPFGFAVTVACLILPFLITLLCSRTRVSNLSPPTLNNSGVPYGCQHSGAG